MPPPPIDSALATLVEHLPLAAMLTDEKVRIQLVNAKFTEVTGYEEHEVLGKNPRLLHSGRHDDAFYGEMWRRLLADGYWEGEIWNRRKGGEVYPQLLSISALRDGEKLLHYAAAYSEITELRSSDNRLIYLAYHDPLTHLPNRMLFQDRLERAMARARRNTTKFGVLVADLDGFKDVNDALGHSFGDRLLRISAHLLVGALREADTVSRYGGDEFIIIVEGAERAEDVERVAHRLVQSFGRPVHLAPHEVSITVSIGVAVFPDDGTEAQTLIDKADAAMYRAKAAGKNTYRS